MTVSLIIPAYNEEKRLVPFLEKILQYLRRHPNEIKEIIIVNDGSTDDTANTARHYQTKINRLKVIAHSTNQGKGAAVQTGVMASRGDYIIFIDADGATPISELPKMIEALEKTDIAVGSRWLAGAKTERHSWVRQLSGWTNQTYMRLLGLGAVDVMCGFKGYRRAAALDLFKNLQEKRWLFDTEIAYKTNLRGYKITNFPIRWTSQDGSKLSTITLLKSALQIWPLTRRIKRQEKHVTGA